MPFTNDESRDPVLVTTWVGETTLADVAAYNAWMETRLERARREGKKLATISDAVGVTRTPPEVRRALSSSELQTDVVVGNWVVGGSAFLRGVMAALRWANPKFASVRMVATLDQALKEASVALGETPVRMAK